MKNIIAWDLGATKCAAGIVEFDPLTHQFECKKKYSIKLADTFSLIDLIEKLESGLGCSMADVDAVCIGAAGHYNGESLIYENGYAYAMNFAETAKKLRWPAFAVIHDYAPIVCATFTSYMNHSDNVKRLNDCVIDTHGRRVALGIGTGLGLKDGVLFSNGDFWLGQNEIGHIGIPTPPAAVPSLRKRHQDLMNFFHDQDPESTQPITFEKILSGQGIVNFYQFFYPEEKNITPADVGTKMHDGEAPEVLSAFAWYLGLLIGTVQLTFMPPGGIWITGGVALNHLDVFDQPEFFHGIKSSPAYMLQREQYPLGVLCSQDHALIGGAFYAVKKLISGG